jgi:4-carboxymuconolactone decarboxylase
MTADALADGNAGPRIPMFDPASMTEEQARIYRDIVNGPRGRLVGPLRAVLHLPQLADHWQRMGEFLRYRSSLPKTVVELAILVTARRWNSQVEWCIHAREAAAAGLPRETIEAIRRGLAPHFTDTAEADVYEFARQLQHRGDVEDALYGRLHARWGTTGLVTLTSIIGYYTMVSMTLNVHAVPMPDDNEEALLSPPGSGSLTDMPPRAAPQAETGR